MSNHISLESLRQIQFLHSIADEHLKQISDIAELFTFQEGEILFREGAAAEYVYLIISGNISLEICAPGVGCRRIVTIGTGEMLGCSTLIEQSKLTETATALETTRVLRIEGDVLLELCDRNPQFGHQLMKRTALALAKRLSAARLQLLDVFGVPKPEGEF